MIEIEAAVQKKTMADVRYDARQARRRRNAAGTGRRNQYRADNPDRKHRTAAKANTKEDTERKGKQDEEHLRAFSEWVEKLSSLAYGRWAIWCAGPHDVYGNSDEDLRVAAATEFIRMGWTHRPGVGVLCPECSEKPNSEIARTGEDAT